MSNTGKSLDLAVTEHTVGLLFTLTPQAHRLLNAETFARMARLVPSQSHCQRIEQRCRWTRDKERCVHLVLTRLDPLVARWRLELLR